MKLIVCLDDHGGMLFNHRRQSQDRILQADLLAMTQGTHLYMNAYSARQFEFAPEITVVDSPEEAAGPGDWCFAEDRPLSGCASKIEELVVYRWNRSYPADRYFDLSLDTWHLAVSAEFAGSSHEKITKEIYVP